MVRRATLSCLLACSPGLDSAPNDPESATAEGVPGEQLRVAGAKLPSITAALALARERNFCAVTIAIDPGKLEEDLVIDRPTTLLARRGQVLRGSITLAGPHRLSIVGLEIVNRGKVAIAVPEGGELRLHSVEIDAAGTGISATDRDSRLILLDTSIEVGSGPACDLVGASLFANQLTLHGNEQAIGLRAEHAEVMLIDSTARGLHTAIQLQDSTLDAHGIALADNHIGIQLTDSQLSVFEGSFNANQTALLVDSLPPNHDPLRCIQAVAFLRNDHDHRGPPAETEPTAPCPTLRPPPDVPLQVGGE